MVDRTFILIISIVLTAASSGGCNLLFINDPNHNEKIRYSMAHGHAARVLKESGSALEPYRPDYDYLVFFRRHYDESTHAFHSCELYDFLKISDKPGPERFVIAYEKETKKTYLRTDLRTNLNIDRLPTTQPASE